MALNSDILSVIIIRDKKSILLIPAWEELFISKKAFLFQGVGTNDTKKSMEVFNDEEMEIFLNLCERASEITGLDIRKFISDSSSLTGLDGTFANWIIASLCDCTVYETLISKGIYPDYIAGYSVGLNNVCYCTGSVSLEDSIKLLYGGILSIIELTKKSVKYGMGVIIGLDYKSVSELIALHSTFEKVTVSSENSDTFIVISGFLDEIKKLLQKSAEEGAIKTILLDVPCAFHSSLMKDYANGYFDNVSGIFYADSNTPIVSIYDQKIITSAEDIKKELQRNYIEPMKWRQTVKYLEDAGVTEFWDMSTLAANKKASRLTGKESKFKTIKSLRIPGGLQP